jgi:uncharacterized membrane protein (UPF0127 family)
LLACSPQAPAAQSPNEQSAPAQSTPATSVPAEQQPQTGLREVPLTIQSKNGAHRFTVQVAATPAQQEKGLMFVTSLGDDRGMIFPYQPPQETSFWMKNTLIPLDIIYIGVGGKIVRIVNAKALDETPLPSGAPVIGVLEIRGGRAAELGIREGDKVSWTH